MTSLPWHTLLIVGAMLGCFGSRPAPAQASYPTQPIKLIVPASPGGLPDTVARTVGRSLQERLGQPIIVENRAGANGDIGAAALLSLPADGRAFIVWDGGLLSTNPLLHRSLPYRPQDLVPVVLLARAPIFLAATSKLPVKTMGDFIDYVRAHPGQLSYGSSGVGSFHHLSMEAIKASLGLNLVHVPYKGTGESVPALLGGHVDVLLSSYGSLKGAVEEKMVRLLATNGLRRSALAPDVPPVADFVPGFDFTVMMGIFARSGTPSAIIERVATEAAAVVKEDAVVRQFATLGIEPDAAGTNDFKRALQSEIERVAKAVKAAGLEAR